MLRDRSKLYSILVLYIYLIYIPAAPFNLDI